MATLNYVGSVHIAKIQTRIPIPYFCTVQESQYESVPPSKSGNAIKPLDRPDVRNIQIQKVKIFEVKALIS